MDSLEYPAFLSAKREHAVLPSRGNPLVGGFTHLLGGFKATNRKPIACNGPRPGEAVQCRFAGTLFLAIAKDHLPGGRSRSTGVVLRTDDKAVAPILREKNEIPAKSVVSTPVPKSAQF
jgi:hypothetical protein